MIQDQDIYIKDNDNGNSKYYKVLTTKDFNVETTKYYEVDNNGDEKEVNDSDVNDDNRKNYIQRNIDPVSLTTAISNNIVSIVIDNTTTNDHILDLVKRKIRLKGLMADDNTDFDNYIITSVNDTINTDELVKRNDLTELQNNVGTNTTNIKSLSTVVDKKADSDTVKKAVEDLIKGNDEIKKQILPIGCKVVTFALGNEKAVGKQNSLVTDINGNFNFPKPDVYCDVTVKYTADKIPVNNFRQTVYGWEDISNKETYAINSNGNVSDYDLPKFKALWDNTTYDFAIIDSTFSISVVEKLSASNFNNCSNMFTLNQDRCKTAKSYIIATSTDVNISKVTFTFNDINLSTFELNGPSTYKPAATLQDKLSSEGNFNKSVNVWILSIEEPIDAECTVLIQREVKDFKLNPVENSISTNVSYNSSVTKDNDKEVEAFWIQSVNSKVNNCVTNEAFKVEINQLTTEISNKVSKDNLSNIADLAKVEFTEDGKVKLNYNDLQNKPTKLTAIDTYADYNIDAMAQMINGLVDTVAKLLNNVATNDLTLPDSVKNLFIKSEKGSYVGNKLTWDKSKYVNENKTAPFVGVNRISANVSDGLTDNGGDSIISKPEKP